MSFKPVLSLVAAALLAAAAADPAFAQRGRGGDRGGDRGDRHRNDDRGRNNNNNNWDRNRDHDRNDWNRRDRDRHDNDWNLSFSFGTPYYGSYGNYYRPRNYYNAPTYYNAWRLRPYQCRVDVEYDHWYGRPADIEIRRCADAYGNVYIVQGAQRLYRYRY